LSTYFTSNFQAIITWVLLPRFRMLWRHIRVSWVCLKYTSENSFWWSRIVWSILSPASPLSCVTEQNDKNERNKNTFSLRFDRSARCESSLWVYHRGSACLNCPLDHRLKYKAGRRALSIRRIIRSTHRWPRNETDLPKEKEN
jgi:hypothetical protein